MTVVHNCPRCSNQCDEESLLDIKWFYCQFEDLWFIVEEEIIYE